MMAKWYQSAVERLSPDALETDEKMCAMPTASDGRAAGAGDERLLAHLVRERCHAFGSDGESRLVQDARTACSSAAGVVFIAK